MRGGGKRKLKRDKKEEIKIKKKKKEKSFKSWYIIFTTHDVTSENEAEI